MGLHDIMDKMIRFYVVVSQFSHHKAQAHLDSFIIYVRGCSFTRGGTRIFLRMPRGGPEKIGDPRSQTDGPPPGKK